MPQRTAFPFLPAGPPRAAVEALIAAFAAVPEGGEPARALRDRLKEAGLWKRDRGADGFAFFGVGTGDTVQPSQLTRRLREASPADRATIVAEWLWAENPLLFKACVDLLGERPHTRDEIVTHVSSLAYRGKPLSRLQIQSWLQLAIGLEVLRVVGIALVVDDRGKPFVERSASFEIDDYLEDELEALEAQLPEHDDEPVDATEEPAPSEQQHSKSVSDRPIATPSSYTNPHQHGNAIDVARLRRGQGFAAELLDESRARIDSWWSEQSRSRKLARADDFGIEPASWIDGSGETLYRLAVAAALVFRLPGDTPAVIAAFRGLDSAGVLGDLFFGTAPDELPTGVDSQALMLASLVARRCAEHPDLAASLEQQESAAAAFAELESALGRGLFELELFWMMRGLGEIGAVRAGDVPVVSTIPTRQVRDTLFRLGYLESPYASGSDDLLRAAAAATRATAAPEPDVVLEAFATAAGCGYGCERRRICGFACRERIDVARSSS